MAGNAPSVTNTFVANTKAKSSEINTNYTDIINAFTDQTKDYTHGTSYYKVGTTAASHTLTSTDSFRYFDFNVNTSTGYSCFLPTAASNSGRILGIKNIGATTGSLTISPNGSDLIDSATSLLLPSQYDSVDLISDGTNWKILSINKHNRWQRKRLSASVNYSADQATIAGLSFNGLTVGKKYEIQGIARIVLGTGSVNFGVTFKNGSTAVCSVIRYEGTLSGATSTDNIGFSTIFDALTTTLDAVQETLGGTGGSSQIEARSDGRGTFAILKELNNYSDEVTVFS